MTRANRERQQLLVCNHRAGCELKSTVLGGFVVRESARSVVFDVSARGAAVRDAVGRFGFSLTPRYMDQFYFCIASSSASDLRGVMDDFFGSIAQTYHHRVDIVRNRENASNLLKLICLRAEQGGPILDFGCGIGLAKPVAQRFGVDLIGYEPNRQMRVRALKAGLRTWGTDGLRSCPEKSLRGAMASYVLHLPGVLEDLQTVWFRLLRPSGVLVGNFHKSHGRRETVEALAAWGARVEAVESPVSSRRHGDYVVFYRT